MYKVIKYRTYDYPPPNYPFKRGWRTVVPKTFEHIFKHLPISVSVLNARIYKQVSGMSIADAVYELIDAWDWLRMGIFPACDKVFERLIQENPAKYRATSKGVWVHRPDLVPNASETKRND